MNKDFFNFTIIKYIFKKYMLIGKPKQNKQFFFKNIYLLNIFSPS